MNNDKIIIDLCGGTGSWSKPYKDAGYDVRVITLPEYDVLDIDCHDAAGAIYVLNKNNDLGYRPIHVMDIYGILAAPPCTEFSLAKNNNPRNFTEAMKVVSKCLEIIWFARGHKYSSLKFWSMENPRGFLRQFIGKPPFTFEQWEYGDIGIKPTDLWGYYKIPTKIVKCRPEGLTKKFPNGRINSVSWTTAHYPDEYKNLGIAALRAMTPPGFAKAFFEANR